MGTLLDDLARIPEVVFLQPDRVWLGVALIVVLALVVLAARRKRGTGHVAVWALLLRGLALAALVAVLMDPVISERKPREGRLLVLADVSPSMGPNAQSRMQSVIDAITTPFDLIAFGAEPKLITNGQLERDPRNATDVGAALNMAAARTDGERPTRAVLLSDGRATVGGAEQAALDLRRRGTTLLATPLPRTTAQRSPNLKVTRIEVPPPDDLREPFEVRARVQAEATGPAHARLLVNGVSRVDRRIELQRGENEIKFDGVTLPAGSYTIQVLLSGDQSPLDNIATKSVVVPGTPQVVCIASHARRSLVAEALKTQGFQVEVKRAADVDFAGKDVVILLPDAPAEEIDARAGELAAFVGKRGGGLLAIGGTDGPGLARLHRSPVSFLLPLEVEPRVGPTAPPPSPKPGDEPRVEVHEEETEAYPITLCLLVDVSVSMQGAKLERAKEAAAAAAAALTSKDRIIVLAFSDRVQVVVPPTPAGNAGEVAHALTTLRVVGNTAMFNALSAGYAVLAREESPIRHMVLLSDGQPTDRGPWRTLVTEATKQKMTLSTVSIGFDTEMRMMSRLASWGRGKTWSANHPRDIPQVVTLDTQRVVQKRDKRGKDAEQERKKPKQPKPPVEKPEPPQEQKPQGPPPPPQQQPILLDPSAPMEAFRGLDQDALPQVSGVEEGKPRHAAWVAARAGKPETKDGSDGGDGDAQEAQKGTPLLAYWRVGLGTSAALMVDPESGSGQGLRESPELSRILAQTVRSVLPDVGREAFVLEHRVSGEGNVDLFALRVFSEDGRARTDLPVRVTPQDDRDGGGPLRALRRGDRYEVALPDGAPGGPYRVEIGPIDGPLLSRVLYLPRSRSREGVVGADKEALLRLVGQRDRLVEDPGPFLEAPNDTVESERPLSLPFLLLAAILLPLDAWIRRKSAPASR